MSRQFSNPFEAIFGKVDMTCTVCGTAQSVGCDCWTKCRTPGCTWSYRKGEICPNCNTYPKR